MTVSAIASAGLSEAEAAQALDRQGPNDLDRFHLAMDVIRDWQWPLQEGTSS